MVILKRKNVLIYDMVRYYRILEVRGPSGPQLLVGGPSGHLVFVLCALRALRPRLTHWAAEILSRTDEQGDSRSRIQDFYVCEKL